MGLRPPAEGPGATRAVGVRRPSAAAAAGPEAARAVATGAARTVRTWGGPWGDRLQDQWDARKWGKEGCILHVYPHGSMHYYKQCFSNCVEV